MGHSAASIAPAPTDGTPRITDADVDAIASASYADRRTVLRRLVGLPVRGRAAERVDAAIRARLGGGAR